MYEAEGGTQELTNVVEGEQPTGVDYHYDLGRIYWTDPNLNKVSVCETLVGLKRVMLSLLTAKINRVTSRNMLSLMDIQLHYR